RIFLPLNLEFLRFDGLLAQYRSPIVSPRRDGGSSAAPQPVLSVSTRRHFSPGTGTGISPDRTGSPRVTSIAAWPRPSRRASDLAGHPLTRRSATRIHARAAGGAEQSRKPLFGEPGGLRSPRAELDKTRTSRSRTSRLSTKF